MNQRKGSRLSRRGEWWGKSLFTFYIGVDTKISIGSAFNWETIGDLLPGLW